MCLSKPAMPAKVADTPAAQPVQQPNVDALRVKQTANRKPGAAGSTVLTGPMGAPAAPTGKVTLLGQ